MTSRLAPIISLVVALGGAASAQGHALRSSAAMRPSSDFYVTAAQRDGRFGSARRLVIRSRPVSHAFLRFALRAPLAPGQRAILHLYAQRASTAGVTLRHASDRPWPESGTTFRTAPGTGPRIVRSGPLRRHRWRTVDVSSLTSPTGAVSLALATTGGTPVVLASREGGATSSKLSVMTSSAADSATVPARSPAGAAGPTGVAAATPAQLPPPAPTGLQPSSAGPCGVAAAPPTWQHVVWIVLENHSYGQVIGSPSTPYTNALALECGVASDYWAEARPSLPNYVAMTSGSTQGVTDDNPPSSHPLSAPSIFSQLGSDWRSLQESMPTNCAQSSSGLYAVKHNPAAYYTNIREACDRLDVPMGDPPDVSARFTFITPDMCDSTHDCSVQVGDVWLRRTITKILDSPEYRSGTTALFLTYDEGAGDQHIATIVVSPSTRSGTVDGLRYDHYSMLRTTEEMLGLPVILGAAVMAPSLRSAFNL